MTWPEEAEFVQWGEVMERAAAVPGEHDGIVNYELRTPNAAVTRRPKE